MTVSVATYPNSTALTTVAVVKEELLVTSASDDTYLERLIDQASDTITHWAGRPLYRAQFLETRMGNDRAKLALSRYPVVSLDAVTYSTSAITDADIDLKEAGLIYREGTFGTGNAVDEWSFKYTAGWFLPGDDMTLSVSVDATDDSYNSATSGFTTLLRSGDVIYGSDFSNAPNNGFKTVVTATAAKITVSEALTTETAGTRTLALRTLPGWIERCAIDLVKFDFAGRTRDSSVRSVTIGPASFMYANAPAVESVRQRIERLSWAS